MCSEPRPPTAEIEAETRKSITDKERGLYVCILLWVLYSFLVKWQQSVERKTTENMFSTLKKKFGRNRGSSAEDKTRKEDDRQLAPTFVFTTSLSDNAPPGKKTAASTQPRGKRRGSPVAGVQNLQVPSSSDHRRGLKQQASSSSIHSGPASTEELLTDGPTRSRVSSDASASSYHTCRDSKSSLLHKHSPTFSRPGTPNSTESLAEVTRSMREMVERVRSLEQTMEAVKVSLEGRVSDIEKHLKIVHQESAVVVGARDDSEKIEKLSVLVEVKSYIQPYIKLLLS